MHLKDHTYLRLRSEVAARLKDDLPLFPAERLSNADPHSNRSVGMTVTAQQEALIRAFGGGNGSAGLRRMLFLLEDALVSFEESARKQVTDERPFG